MSFPLRWMRTTSPFVHSAMSFALDSFSWSPRRWSNHMLALLGRLDRVLHQALGVPQTSFVQALQSHSDFVAQLQVLGHGLLHLIDEGVDVVDRIVHGIHLVLIVRPHRTDPPRRPQGRRRTYPPDHPDPEC